MWRRGSVGAWEQSSEDLDDVGGDDEGVVVVGDDGGGTGVVVQDVVDLTTDEDADAAATTTATTTTPKTHLLPVQDRHAEQATIALQSVVGMANARAPEQGFLGTEADEIPLAAHGADDATYVQVEDDDELSLNTTTYGEVEMDVDVSVLAQGVPPWAQNIAEHPHYGDDLLTSLTVEMGHVVSYLEATPAEEGLRADLDSRLQAVVHSVFPDSLLHCFGSHPAGLVLPHSDMDYVVLNIPRGGSPLRLIARAIRIARMPSKMQLISKARVPIIKLTDKVTGIDLDISFGIDGGVKNTSAVKQFIQMYPEARPLSIIIKYLLKQHNLNEPYLGGLGSYALFLLIISFLQMRVYIAPDPSLPAEKVDANGNSVPSLGRLLLDFLRYYGSMFNFYSVAISVLDGGCLFPKEHMSEEGAVPGIQDPQDPYNNVGGSCFDIVRIRSFFRAMYNALIMPIDPQATSSLLQRVLVVPQDLLQWRSQMQQRWEELEAEAVAKAATAKRRSADRGSHSYRRSGSGRGGVSGRGGRGSHWRSGNTSSSGRKRGRFSASKDEGQSGHRNAGATTSTQKQQKHKKKKKKKRRSS